MVTSNANPVCFFSPSNKARRSGADNPEYRLSLISQKAHDRKPDDVLLPPLDDPVPGLG